MGVEFDLQDTEHGFYFVRSMNAEDCFTCVPQNCSETPRYQTRYRIRSPLRLSEALVDADQDSKSLLRFIGITQYGLVSELM